MTEAQQYAAEIWEAFLSETKQCRLMAPAEWELLRGWLEARIPLRVVLRAFQDTAGGRGRALHYYAPSVREAEARWRQSMTG